jgi:cysteine desulfurase / selenocysteine lyase
MPTKSRSLASLGTTNTLVDRKDFPLLAKYPDLHYLDSAATSQKPRAVLDAMRDYYENDNANPHRGAYELSARATDRYHQARERIAQFVGVADSACLIFVRGTTEALNLVSWTWAKANLREGDEIVLTGMEHHANFVPWQQVAIERKAKVKIVRVTEHGAIDMDDMRAQVTPRTRLIAFNHVSNALGTINPVAEIVALAKSVGAVTVCDGAQAVPHLPVSVDALDVDFYAFSGHKMLGPMGSGVLIGRRALLEKMPPYQTGGDMISVVEDHRSTWNVLPHKFEAGTPNVADAVGLAAACDYLDAIGMDRIRAHELELLEYATQQMRSVRGVTLFGPEDLAYRSGVVSFTLEGVHPHDIATILDQNGVCVRAGHHCAQPLMRRMNVPATARASVYVYSTRDDVDALVTGVERVNEIFG